MLFPLPDTQQNSAGHLQHSHTEVTGALASTHGLEVYVPLLSLSVNAPGKFALSPPLSVCPSFCPSLISFFSRPWWSHDKIRRSCCDFSEDSHPGLLSDLCHKKQTFVVSRPQEFRIYLLLWNSLMHATKIVCVRV